MMLTISDVDRAGPQPARQVLNWVREYLGGADAERERLQRKFVCPFIPGALQRETIWLDVVAGAVTPAAVEATMRAQVHLFHHTAPITGVDVQYKTILTLFPGVTENTAPELIDQVQRTLKLEVVTQHLLMIGELHPWNWTEAAGFLGEGIYPNRSPVPLLALRVIVSQDYPKFLKVPIRAGTAVNDFLADLRYQIAYYDALIRWAPIENHPSRRQQWQELLAEKCRLLSELSG